MLIKDRDGNAHDPISVAEFLDGLADKSNVITAEDLHDAADVVRGLIKLADDLGDCLDSVCEFCQEKCLCKGKRVEP